MEWISVKDRLPCVEFKQEEVIICFIDDLVTCGWFEKDSQKFKEEHNGCYVIDVTHWMPLPKAPE